MEPTKPTLRVLFASPSVYKIPYYQRSYVWDQENQWEPLWFDVTSVANNLINANQEAVAKQKPHFLGAAVLKEVTKAGEEVRVFTVVDGQQRITTTQLLLAAVADTFKQFTHLQDSERLARSLIVNSIGTEESVSAPFKINPLGRDFASFNEVMEASRAGAHLRNGAGRMGECYRFFLGKTTEWLGEEETEEAIRSKARALLAAVSDKLQIVAIHLETGENEYAIFEALNARGEPLSEWEKIKNYILYKAGEIPEVDQSEFYKEHLEGMDESTWREETGSGGNRRRKSDLFLDYWLESRLSQPINARYVFREFRKVADAISNDELVQWCSEINLAGRYFMEWEGLSALDGDVHALFHSRRNVLRIGAIWPVLLALLRIEIDEKDRDRCFRTLDSFLWRRAILGMSTRSYDEITQYLLKALSRGLAGDLPYSSAIIEDLLDSQGHSRLLWPSDDAVRDRILTTPIYLYGSQERTTHVLLETIERALMRGKYPGNTALSSRLPIEHIMPQTRDEGDWPLPVDADEHTESRREIAIHTLGNLTLVEHGLNSKLSNRPWSGKRTILQEEDNLYINKDLLNHALATHWDEDQIRLRGERLADYIIEIWPHGHAVTPEIERVKTKPTQNQAAS